MKPGAREPDEEQRRELENLLERIRKKREAATGAAPSEPEKEPTR